MHDKTVVGWVEYVDFPDWGITGLKAKVDTGARTSAVHVENLEAIDHNHVAFDIVIGQRQRRHHHMKAKVLKWARVRSSNGHYTERCFVKTLIRLGAVEKEIELSLVSREEMQFRMLIGRKALERDFLVDVSKRAAASRRAKAKRGRRH
jgi:hypothetical protein